VENSAGTAEDEQATAMSTLWIEGQVPLDGTVTVGGSKNSALALIAAAALASEGEVILDNVAPGRDVTVMCDILKALGAAVHWNAEGALVIRAERLAGWEAPYELASKIRTSTYILGALVTRQGDAAVAFPGGCQIGSRPVDFHIRGLEALGARVELEHGTIRARVSGRLTGTRFYVERASVGTTANMMIAAALADGTTLLENAAMEPEIVDLANFLNAMGARVRGAGTNVVRVEGVPAMHGARHEVIPDRLEAATYLMAGVATRGRVEVTHMIPEHLRTLVAKLQQMGASVTEGPDWVAVEMNGRPAAVDVETLPYPGFPTDLQPPMAAVLATAEGIAVVQETIFDNRFAYTHELARMGAQIKVDRDTAIIRGVPVLTGAPVEAHDLRGGIALVLAGLGAEQVTTVSGMEHVDRGYVQLEEKLKSLGAHVRRGDG
jgi:UDP-N-acetylglucosamine 1-carboxyvinyltransferase